MPLSPIGAKRAEMLGTILRDSVVRTIPASRFGLLATASLSGTKTAETQAARPLDSAGLWVLCSSCPEVVGGPTQGRPAVLLSTDRDLSEAGMPAYQGFVPLPSEAGTKTTNVSRPGDRTSVV